MAQENVEIVRGIYDAFAAGDLAALSERSDPRLVTVRYEPDLTMWHGFEGFLQATADWTSGFDEFSITADELLDAGDSVIVLFHQSARGRSSGAVVEADFWFVHKLANGKITRLAMYATKELAFKAVGLEE